MGEEASTNYYEILQVSPSTDQEMIERAHHAGKIHKQPVSALHLFSLKTCSIRQPMN